MNQQLKTVLLTVLTLSVFVVALVELSGVSSTAIFNKYNIDIGGHKDHNHGNVSAAGVPKTVMAFEDTKHDFGTIKEGDVVKYAFKFKNAGDNPLIISNAQASCGCTVPSFPKEPIAPGQSGEIVVEFSSDGRPGHQQKNVLVYSNAQLEAMSIGFVTEVTPKP